MQRDRIPKLLKITNRGEEETEDDQWRDSWTSRPERVNEWPNSLNVWWWWTVRKQAQNADERISKWIVGKCVDSNWI
jgi:hypothetical protein